MDLGFQNSSPWWKGFSLVIFKQEDPCYWFMDGITRKFGLRFHMFIWSDPWIKNIPLKDRFPRLFTISDYPRESMEEVGMWVDETLIWDFGWGGFSSFMRNILLQNLLGYSEHIFSLDAYKWIWKHARNGSFLVFSTYHSLFPSSILSSST